MFKCAISIAILEKYLLYAVAGNIIIRLKNELYARAVSHE